jgi:hypothetical protein
MRTAWLVRRTARVAVAAFAATSAGVIASSLVPILLLQLPPSLLLAPPKPLLVFSLTCVMLFGIPIFLVASSQRQGSLGLGSYIGYSVVMSVLVMLLSTFALVPLNSFSGTKFYDAVWVMLTEAVPGGVVAGMIAHMAMNLGIKYEDRLDPPAAPTAK